MNPQLDYALRWPDLFQDVPEPTRELVLRTLQDFTSTRLEPSRTDARILIDFAMERITAREFGQQTLAHLRGEDDGAAPTPEPAPAPVTMPIMTVEEQPPAPVLSHDGAALAFVGGVITAEQFIRAARARSAIRP